MKTKLFSCHRFTLAAMILFSTVLCLTHTFLHMRAFPGEEESPDWTVDWISAPDPGFPKPHPSQVAALFTNESKLIVP